MLVIVSLLLVWLLSNAGCKCQRTRTVILVSPDSGVVHFVLGDVYNIPEKEIDAVVDVANRGDAAAAMRLHWYWGIYKKNQDQAYYWLRKAATNGSSRGQYILAEMMLSDSTLGSADEVMDLLEKASAGGISIANYKLRELKGKADATFPSGAKSGSSR